MLISKLNYITAHPAHAEQACKSGVDWVQLRVKGKSDEEWKALAMQTQAICKKYSAKLIINDNVALAKEIGADGVHLGKEDMPPADARKLLGDGFIIGGTANTFEDIQRLARAGMDYIGLGPFRFTETKNNLSPLLGLEGYKELMEACKRENINIPVIAIGGIKVDDVKALLDTGIYGVAVSSSISAANNISKAAKEFINELSLKVGI